MGYSKQSRRLNEAQRAEAVQLYVDCHLSYHHVARSFGVDPSTIHTCLKEAGVPIRTMAESKQAHVPGATAEVLRRLYWRDGLTLDQVAQRFSVKRPSIESLMNRYGITRRTRSQAQSAERNGFHGKTHSSITKERISTNRERAERIGRAQRGKPKPYMVERNRRNWSDPKWVSKFMQRLSHTPTFPELLVKSALERAQAPFIHNRDDSVLVIARRVPDFRPFSSRVVVEVFGEAFHDPASRNSKYVLPHRTAEGTRAHYSKNGYKCVILWAKDILSHSKSQDLDDWVIGQIAEQTL